MKQYSRLRTMFKDVPRKSSLSFGPRRFLRSTVLSHQGEWVMQMKKHLLKGCYVASMD